MTKIYMTMMAVGLVGFAMAMTGCAGNAVEGPSAPAHVDAALSGCWQPIASEAPPAVEWVGGSGYSIDSEGTIYVAWHVGESIAATQFAAALDAYFQLHVTERPDLTAEHVAHCNAYLQAVGL